MQWRSKGDYAFCGFLSGLLSVPIKSLFSSLTLKAPPIICSRRQFQIVLFFTKITNKAWHFMRIVCWQTILMKYHSLIFSKIRKDVIKFVVCCCRDWRFKSKRFDNGNSLSRTVHIFYDSWIYARLYGKWNFGCAKAPLKGKQAYLAVLYIYIWVWVLICIHILRSLCELLGNAISINYSCTDPVT